MAVRGNDPRTPAGVVAVVMAVMVVVVVVMVVVVDGGSAGGREGHKNRGKANRAICLCQRVGS